MQISFRLIASIIIPITFANFAVAQTHDDIEAQYEQERSYCATLSEPGRSACLREAAAVRQEARKGLRANEHASYRLNRITRCDRLPTELREDCLKLMSERAKADIQGSVEGGGVIRKMTIEIPAPVPQPQPDRRAVHTVPPPMPAQPLPVELDK